MRGKDLETEEFSEERRIEQFEILKECQAYTLDLTNWHEFLKVLMRAGFRSGDMISSEVGVVYAYTLYLIGKRDYKVEPFALRNAIARWFFMTSLTGRYTGSPETQMDKEFVRLRSVKSSNGFVEVLNKVVDETLTDDYWNITLPNELATSSAQSPAMFAYYASLCLLDANVLFSKMKVSELLDPSVNANKSAVERHHLFPKNFLKRIGVTEKSDVNQIANYALIEWSDNIDILDSSPAEYLPKYEARFSKTELDQMNYWHALPHAWASLNYQKFLSE